VYVCICAAVTEAEIVSEIEAGAHTQDEISDITLAGTGCGTCVERIGGLLEENVPASCPRRALLGLAASA
jgi:bacterioferritin-associated ferredoxin